jgi:hypothetical protein
VLYTVAHVGASNYVDNYIDGYYATVGMTLDPGTGDVTYQNFDELDVLDDDGIDLFNMTSDRVLNSITIEGGVNHQAFVTLGRFPTYDGQRLVGPFIAADALIAEVPAFAPQSEYLRIQEVEVSWAAQYVEEDDPSTVLGRDPTRVSIDLLPIGTQAFETNYAPVVSALAVPQTIDTEAP